MPITGTDEISLKILDSLRSGVKLKDIPSMFPVSLNQVKRLSRYANILEKANTYLHTSEIEKLQIMGIKSLYLSSLFKQEDWEGLVEILSSINKHTKRDEFPLLIQALQGKRKRISDFQQEVERMISYLNRREQELKELEGNMKETQKKIKEEAAFLNKYPDEPQRFLIKHLGVYEDKLVLARRLDSRWQRSLKKKNILRYSDWEYIWMLWI